MSAYAGNLSWSLIAACNLHSIRCAPYVLCLTARPRRHGRLTAIVAHRHRCLGVAACMGLSIDVAEHTQNGRSQVPRKVNAPPRVKFSAFSSIADVEVQVHANGLELHEFTLPVSGALQVEPDRVGDMDIGNRDVPVPRLVDPPTGDFVHVGRIPALASEVTSP